MPEAPWDTSPSTDSQHAYIDTLLDRIVRHDRRTLDVTMASALITKLNNVRTFLGVPFRDIDGTDGTQR